MLYCLILCYDILYHTICTVLYYNVLQCIMRVLRYGTLYFITLHYTIVLLYYTTLHYNILDYTSHRFMRYNAHGFSLRGKKLSQPSVLVHFLRRIKIWNMTNRISWFKVAEPKLWELPSRGQAAVSETKWLIGRTSAYFLQPSSNVDNESFWLHKKFLTCFFFIENICKTF